jgi:ABC-type antimicrobial peptide transport system permease subunit
LLESLLGGVSLLFTLFVLAISLALAAAETRDERDVLSVLGASPSTMRRTSARKAVLLTVLGSLLAIPVGFLPVAVFTAVTNDNLPLRFPWRVTLLLLAAVPVIVTLATSAASAIALRIRPTHVSTMAFD